MTTFKNFLRDESGASAAEYAIILAIIGSVLVLSMQGLRDAIGGAVDAAAGVVTGAATS